MEDKFICKRCEREKIKYCKGLCKSCYNFLNRNKEKHKKYLKKWREKNPDYFKNYNKERKNE